MRKSLCLFVVLLLILTLPINASAQDVNLSILSPSVILVEKTTGEILYEKNPDEVMRPASVTKIMTLILIMEALENGQFDLDDIVTASAHATSMGGSQVYLKEGEQMTVDEMLKCIVISSANDACVAMAEFVSGSVQEFVLRMNEKAKELGMSNTNFVNCTGLEADGHLTTARDISVMSRELLKYDMIKKYTTVWMDTIRNGEFGLTNTNKLIRFYEGATGLKTGYTAQSKYCISATAQKNGMELIAVVMAANTIDERSDDAKALLNYGFSKYSLYFVDNLQIDSVKVLKGKNIAITPVMENDLKIVVEKKKENQVKCQINLASDVMAPVTQGQKLGEIIVTCDGKEIAKTNLISPENIEKATFKEVFLKMLNYFLIF